MRVAALRFGEPDIAQLPLPEGSLGLPIIGETLALLASGAARRGPAGRSWSMPRPPAAGARAADNLCRTQRRMHAAAQAQRQSPRAACAHASPHLPVLAPQRTPLARSARGGTAPCGRPTSWGVRGAV